ncbi:DNA translocase FtsK [Planctomycetota bacterium]
MTRQDKVGKKAFQYQKVFAICRRAIVAFARLIWTACRAILSFIRKKPIAVCGILLSVCGVFSLVVVLMPGRLGKIGELMLDRGLEKLFGKATFLAIAYLLAMGAVLLVSKRRLRHSIALICALIPLLIGADLLLSTPDVGENTKAIVPPVFLGNILRLSLMYLGLGVLSLGLLLFGLLLMIPQPVLDWVKMRRSRSEASPLPQESDPEPEDIVPQESSEFQKSVPEQPAVQLESGLLKLKLYDREFVKIPKGLFEEHVTFNTSLPVGTRRQEIIEAFASFNTTVEIGDVKRGPSFEQYELIPGSGVKASQIRSRVEDVSLRMKQKVHISRLHGGSLAIDVPLADRQIVPYGFLLEDTSDDEMEIPIAVGVDASFSPFSVDLVELPHLLIAGTTGSGKSVFLKTLIASIMYHLTPNEVRLVLVDPKRVEFGVFASSLLSACKIITDFEEVPPVFDALVAEMEVRYELLEAAGASNIRQYNAGVPSEKRQPYIVAVVDEFADLIMQKVDGFEDAIVRLAQKARACGIHLVLATQRPSTDVIKGLLKTNIPGRIALSVASKVDSRIILDVSGAENLTGNGDLICICPAFREGIRLQGAYITKEEIRKIIAMKS